jgi:hypothetical protein
MPQFVLLEHDHPELHWDFMLESGDVLLTWRLDRIPAEADEIPATSLPDHRKAYLDYEGPVSGNRGSVVRIDRGDFELLESADGSLATRLMGMRLRGTARLQKITSDGSPDESLWRMMWQPD